MFGWFLFLPLLRERDYNFHLWLCCSCLSLQLSMCVKLFSILLWFFPFFFNPALLNNFKTCCFGVVLFIFVLFLLSFSAGLVGSPLLCLGSCSFGTLLLILVGFSLRILFFCELAGNGCHIQKAFPSMWEYVCLLPCFEVKISATC